MRTGTLTTVVILFCSFVLAPSLLRANQDDWYQGRRGQWIQQHNAWRFRDRDRNEYRQYGNSWRWYNGANQDHDWYQGRRGHWYQQQNSWRFRDIDGNEYRQYGNSWRWYNGRFHSEEASEYHHRAPGDNRNYQQFQQQEHR
jgi:hypothetical protein